MTSLAAHPPVAGRIERSSSRLWRWLGLVFVLSFGALGYLGWQIYLSAPPIPLISQVSGRRIRPRAAPGVAAVAVVAQRPPHQRQDAEPRLPAVAPLLLPAEAQPLPRAVAEGAAVAAAPRCR